MDNKPDVIQVSNLGKCYHIYDKPKDRIKQIFSRKQYYREFWALQNINFSVKKGEAVGIIGRNGSGKSTLLQMICQTLTPTSGTIKVQGRIAALLELGSGFNPEFTGRENIFLNGSILGLTRHEMENCVDDIIAFADIGDFINQPVKTYSSGMFVRLAFAVQASIKPEILIVDEALSVGDFFFQQKCAQRMQDLRNAGTTLLFVSHDMSSVRDLCEKALYLKSGEQIFYGSSHDAIKLYFAEAQKDAPQPEFNSTVSTITSSSYNPSLIENLKSSACWSNSSSKTDPNKLARLLAIAVTDENNEPTLTVKMAQTIKIQILYQSLSEIPIHISLTLRNRYNHIIHASGSYTSNTPIPTLKVGEISICEIELACMIEAGQYSFSISLANKIGSPNRGISLDETPPLGPITIAWDYEKEKAPWLGMFGLPIQTRFIEAK